MYKHSKTQRSSFRKTRREGRREKNLTNEQILLYIDCVWFIFWIYNWNGMYSDRHVDFSHAHAFVHEYCSNLLCWGARELCIASSSSGHNIEASAALNCLQFGSVFTQNCDEGNGSFTLLHMSRARWILLTVPKWVLHFLIPLIFLGSRHIKIHNVLTIPNKFTHCRDSELTGLSAPVCQGYHKTVCVWGWHSET